MKNIFVSALSGGLTGLLVLFVGVNLMLEEEVMNEPVPVDEDAGFLEYDSDSFVTQEDLIVNAVKKASPSVVSIVISKNVPVMKEMVVDDFMFDPFGGFFGNSRPFLFDENLEEFEENETQLREVGGGSGFLVSGDGLIITNRHVVTDDDAEYTVFMSDGEEYKAEVVARDFLYDLAVLRIEDGEREFPYLKFADSDALEVGQSVIVIGNPLLEFSNSVSVGVVSGLSRSVVADDGFGRSEQLEGVIQTDPAINPGNSGGPLLDLEGNVIGVNVAVAAAENIGFSLPSNFVSSIVKSVQENGRIVRPFMGVRYVPVTEELVELNNLDVDYGVLLLRGEENGELAVIPGSPADKAGLEENNIILEVDGEKIDEDGASLSRIVGSKNVGDSLSLLVLVDGEEKEIKVVLEEFDFE